MLLRVFVKELLEELGWARRTRVKVEEEEGGSAQAERGSGDDCDDEDGCQASGDEDGGESCNRQHSQAHANTHKAGVLKKHLQTLTYIQVCIPAHILLHIYAHTVCRDIKGPLAWRAVMLTTLILQPLGISPKGPREGQQGEIYPLSLSPLVSLLPLCPPLSAALSTLFPSFSFRTG